MNSLSPSDRFTRFVLIGTAVACLLLAGLLWQRADYQYQELSGGSLLFFWLALLAAPAALLALKLSAESRLNLVMIGLSSLLGVYVLEIAVAFLFPQAAPDAIVPYQQAAEKIGAPFDGRKRLEVLADVRKDTPDATLTTSPGLFIEGHELSGEQGPLLPLGGLAQRLTVNCNETGAWSLYQSDEHGFNNPPGSFVPTPTAVLIGDSFAHGACVQAGEDIASLLRAQGYAALTLGYGGTGPLLQLATLREYAAPLKPKAVFWLYFEGNDLDDLRREAETPLLQRYLAEADFSQGLYQRQEEIDRLLKDYIDAQLQQQRHAAVATESPWLPILKLRHLRERLGLAESRPGQYGLLKQILEQAKREVNAWGGQLYFVYLPAWLRYAQPQEEAQLFHRGAVLERVRALDIDLIDMHSVFQMHQDPLSLFPFRIHGHYTPEGYRGVAAQIEKQLR